EPGFTYGQADPAANLRDNLRKPINSKPLSDIVKPEDKVGIIFNDITRATPNHLILPAILDEISFVPRENIILFNALGTHRPNTEAELREILSGELVDQYRIVQNNAFDQSTQVFQGTTQNGHEIWLNRELVECDIKILTGFIEPHLFAGFSGGWKAVMPGMAGLKTVLGNHGVKMLSHPNATWGITHENPLLDEIREIARGVGKTFLVNVTLNKHQEITAVFAGDIDEAHRIGCEFARQRAMIPVDDAFDIVLTTNSGYPLDQNLYQSIKGVSAACQIVRQGGAIIVAAECADGIPEHGLYSTLLREGGSPQGVLDIIRQEGFAKHDQWQAQIQAQIQLSADVYVYSENLSDDQIRSVLLEPASSIEETIRMLLDKYGQNARICVLPEGPQTVPYVVQVI
ncbi:MAG: nickel-dependent lactate racemase, partial [Anaerolineaceae bacterium]|nr:nickel-dependent lactate racemase [Anaerolineaceae bacterium]